MKKEVENEERSRKWKKKWKNEGGEEEKQAKEYIGIKNGDKK